MSEARNRNAAPNAALARMAMFDAATIAAAKNLIARDAPDEIIKLVLYRCETLGVDPFAKMIYAINRPTTNKNAPKLVCPNCGKTTVFKSRTPGEGWYCWRQRDGCGRTFPETYEPFATAEPAKSDNWVLQSSIDFFRSTAESSEGYEGQDGPYWCGRDGKWTDVWFDTAPPAAARVGIYRTKFAAPMYTSARFSSYAQATADGTLTGLWAKMPEVMIAKCAEALAIRRAFPAKLAGLYIAEEMDQAENVLPLRVVEPQAPAIESTTTVHAVPALAPAPADPEREKALSELNALASSLRIPIGRVTALLAAHGQDPAKVIAILKAQVEAAPVMRGRATPNTAPAGTATVATSAMEAPAPAIEAEPSVAQAAAAAVAPVAVAPVADEADAGDGPWPTDDPVPPKGAARASVTTARMAFDGTPYEKRDDRLAFASRVVKKNVASFNDLDDDDLLRVARALHAEMDEAAAGAAPKSGGAPLRFNNTRKACPACHAPPKGAHFRDCDEA